MNLWPLSYQDIPSYQHHVVSYSLKLPDTFFAFEIILSVDIFFFALGWAKAGHPAQE